MLNQRLFILTALIFMLPSLVMAKDVYTWQQCLELALKNNAELAAAVSSIQSSEYQKKASRSPFLPSVSASLNYNNRNSKQKDLGTSSSDDSYTTAVQASLNLFSGLRDYSRLSQAEANIEVANAQYIKTSARILYELKSAFENYFYAKEYSRLSQEIISRREENFKIVSLRYQSGLENKGSLLLSKAYLAQAKYDSLQAHNSSITAQAELAKTLGLREQADFDITGEIHLFDPPPTPPSYEDLAKSTPEYLEAMAQETYYEKEVDVAHSNFSPTLNLTGSVQQSGDRVLDDNSQQASVGLTLTIPLFDGGKDYYGSKSAVSNYAAKKSNRVHVARSLIVDLKDKYVSYVETISKLNADSLFKQAAEVRAKIARNKYNNGLLTFEDWDVIENDLISRQKSYLLSKKERALSEASWYQTLGKEITL